VNVYASASRPHAGDLADGPSANEPEDPQRSRACRDSGYAALSHVVTKQKKDRMESFVFAETFKYYHLLFAHLAIDFDAVTFNTKAHPLKATWPREQEPHALLSADGKSAQ